MRKTKTWSPHLAPLIPRNTTLLWVRFGALIKPWVRPEPVQGLENMRGGVFNNTGISTITVVFSLGNMRGVIDGLSKVISAITILFGSGNTRGYIRLVYWVLPPPSNSLY